MRLGTILLGHGLGNMTGFIKFIREQGVVGLAVGFILGGSITKLVTALVNDIINPILGIVLGKAENLSSASFDIGGAQVRWGHFITALIDFTVIAFVVYVGFRVFKLNALDIPKLKPPAPPASSETKKNKK